MLTKSFEDTMPYYEEKFELARQFLVEMDAYEIERGKLEQFNMKYFLGTSQKSQGISLCKSIIDKQNLVLNSYNDFIQCSPITVMPGVNNIVLEWIARLGTNLQEQILDLDAIRVAFRNQIWQGLNHFQTREVSRQEVKFSRGFSLVMYTLVSE